MSNFYLDICLSNSGTFVKFVVFTLN